MERYSPLWNPFTGDPDGKYGFERQPAAAQVNLVTLAQSVVPLLSHDDALVSAAQEAVDDCFVDSLQTALAAMRCAKLGLVSLEGPCHPARRPAPASTAKPLGLDWPSAAVRGTNALQLVACAAIEPQEPPPGRASWIAPPPFRALPSLPALGFAGERAERVWKPLYAALDGLDFTIFWRQLASYGSGMAGATDEELLRPLREAFYDREVAQGGGGREGEEQRARVAAWVRLWQEELAVDGRADAQRQAAMRRASPKYVPREWMLVEAYKGAEDGDFSELEQLQALFEASGVDGGGRGARRGGVRWGEGGACGGACGAGALRRGAALCWCAPTMGRGRQRSMSLASLQSSLADFQH